MQPRHYLKSINHFKRECVLVGLEGLLFALKLKKNLNYWIDLSDCPGPFCKNISVGLPQWIVLNDPCQQSSYKKHVYFFVYLFFMPELLCYFMFPLWIIPIVAFFFFKFKWSYMVQWRLCPLRWKHDVLCVFVQPPHQLRHPYASGASKGMTFWL